jgi:hypothetical protein
MPLHWTGIIVEREFSSEHYRWACGEMGSSVMLNTVSVTDPRQALNKIVEDITSDDQFTQRRGG